MALSTPFRRWTILTRRLALVALGLTVAICIPPAQAQTAATNPSPDDPLVSATLAPSYIAIGKSLCLRLSLVRQTLDDLTLDPHVRHDANAVVESCKADLESLVAKTEAGHMPRRSQILAIPANLRQARARLLAVIGPDQSQLLQEKMQSLRGEARQQLAQLRLSLDNLKTSAQTTCGCQAVLSDAGILIDRLPDHDLEGDPYAAGRQTMNTLFATIHDRLAAILTTQEQSQLGRPFTELAANRPTTQPSPGKG